MEKMDYNFLTALFVGILNLIFSVLLIPFFPETPFEQFVIIILLMVEISSTPIMLYGSWKNKESLIVQWLILNGIVSFPVSI